MGLFTHIRQHYRHAILFGLLISASILTQAITKENAVKAGFVYNFTKFTVWPDSASTDKNFNLCIVGDDILEGGLEALYGKQAANKPVVLHHHTKGESLKGCHMAFIAKNDKAQMQSALKALSNLPVLTVSDSPDFIQEGGMIGLIRDGNRVGFEVDIAAANDAGLQIGAQLLKLAKKVKGLE